MVPVAISEWGTTISSRYYDRLQKQQENSLANRRVSQMWLFLAACRELTVDYNTLVREVIYVFEHKIYISIHAQNTHIVEDDTSVIHPQLFRRVKFVIMSPRFVKQQYLRNIAIQPAVSCYNLWANIRCSGCSPVGENRCETKLLD